MREKNVRKNGEAKNVRVKKKRQMQLPKRKNESSVQMNVVPQIQNTGRCNHVHVNKYIQNLTLIEMIPLQNSFEVGLFMEDNKLGNTLYAKGSLKQNNLFFKKIFFNLTISNGFQ
ncbi:hypothetical protein POVCU2_0032450 [Plasmodium ovale curtisi]|uniref:Uncharacterized protein n=1 Tax=Plasmodium ovale curtisi TaxID=864141 RepID=A0A1A8WUX6_PLAOA|nr:hypothetical protein POVCU2_0032450 [Plasmodium ovale curtisi]SBS95663.1 hypothetical protein POVCU1_029960 [Plasmodium ovale curtisi]